MRECRKYKQIKYIEGYNVVLFAGLCNMRNYYSWVQGCEYGWSEYSYVPPGRVLAKVLGQTMYYIDLYKIICCEYPIRTTVYSVIVLGVY